MKLYLYLLIILTIPICATSQFLVNLPGDNNIYYDISISKKGNSIAHGRYDVSEPFDFDSGTEINIISDKSTEFLCSYDISGNLNFAFGMEDISPLGLGNGALFPVSSVGVDDDENIYVTGIMLGWIDFDPSDEIKDLKTNSLNMQKGYLASYDVEGNFRFLIDLGQTNLSKIHMEVAPSGNTYMAFSLIGVSDVICPATGTNLGFENGYTYALMSFDNQGDCRFANPYLEKSGFNSNTAARISINGSEEVYLCNILFDDIDLDPGTEHFDFGVDTIQGEYFYIAKYDKEGNFTNASLICENFNTVTFGYAYAFEAGNSGNCYISAQSAGTVNFDLQGGNSITSVLPDMFLASYSSDLSFRYIHSFGAPTIIDYDGSNAVPLDIVSTTKKDIILTGNFTGTKDFDPSEEVLNLSPSDDLRRSFVSPQKGVVITMPF